MAKTNDTNAVTVQELRDVPLSKVAELETVLKATTGYVKHWIVPQSSDKATIVATLRAKSGETVR